MRTHVHHRRHPRDAAWERQALERLAEGGDPKLEHELEGIATTDYERSRGFRKAWDRLLVAFFQGR